MDSRPRVLILGISGEAMQQVVEPLEAAGFAAGAVDGLSMDLGDVELILVGGEDLEAGCRGARAASETAQVVAFVPRASKGLLFQYCLDAGADDVIDAPPEPGMLIGRVRAGVAQARTRAALQAVQRALTDGEEIVAALAAGDAIEGLHDAATRLAEALRFTRCVVLALVGDDPNHASIATASDDPAVFRLPLDLQRYPEVRAAMDAREPVFVEDTASSDLLGEWAAQAAEHGGKSLLVVPLLVEQRPVGALLLRSQTHRPPPDERARRLCALAGRAFALAVRGGKVVEALREQTRRLSLASYDEERRLRAVDQLRDFFESAADGVFVLDGDGRVLYMNRSAEQLTGYSRSGLQARKLHNIIPDHDRDALTEVVKQAAQGVYIAGFDLAITTTSGETLLLSMSTSAALAEHGAVVLSFRDVTLARSLEEELRKTKDFLEKLIDSTVDGIIAADVHGNVIVYNQGAERAFGYPADEVIGVLPVTRLYPEGVAKQVMLDLRSDDFGGVGKLSPSRREILTNEGEVVPVSLTASIMYEDGREIASVGIISDLRDRLRMEQRLAQAHEKLMLTEKQALIAELAGTTAHELNQPLTSVIGYSELLKKRMAPDDGNMRAVEIILREAERMAEIVRKIGKITRYEIKAYVGSTTILDLDKSTR
ncbi:MAG: PAS domain S-box protein [Myxococcales bacterium]|nr:PAS domain S-box protein [Myxococcales bacterium]